MKTSPPNARRTDWVTFDCFGTLVDWNAGFSSILAPFAGNQTPELLRAYHWFERQIEAQRPYRLYRDVLTAALLLAARKVGIALSEAQAQTLPRAWASMPVFADVEPALAALRSSGYKLGVLTNCDNDLFEQTHRRFLCSFDLVVTAEQVRDYKPSLSHFRRFAQESGVAHENWVHVACSWFHDIAPTREMGIRRIWLDREATGEDASAASRRINSAGELVPAVLSLREAPGA